MMLLLWVGAGMIISPAAYLLVFASLFLLWKRDYTTEMLLGFIVILALANNLSELFEFATNTRIIYLLVLSLLFLFNTKDFRPYQKAYISFAPFFIISFIALFMEMAPSFWTGLQKTISYILMFMVVPNFFMKAYREHGSKVYKSIIYIILTLMIVGFVLRLINPEFVTIEGRYTGLFGNPNEMGIYCLLTLIIFNIAKSYDPELFSKKEKWFIYFVIFLSLFYSGSRASLGAVFIFIFFSRFYKSSSWLGFFIFLLSIYGYIWIGGNLPAIIEFLGLEEFFRLRTLEEGGGRFIAWNFAWTLIQDNFFFGRGFDWELYIFRENYMMLSKLGHEGAVHSTYLSMWMNTGIVGLITFFFTLFALIIKASKLTHWAFPFLYAIMFSITFESWLMGSLNPFTILFLIILTMISNEHMVENKPIEETASGNED